MANTYTKIYIEVVFAVRNRQRLIPPLWKAELYKYKTDIIHNLDHKLRQPNSMLCP